MAKIADIQALVEACLETNLKYFEIINEVRAEIGAGLRDSAWHTNRAMVVAYEEKKFPDAIAYKAPLFLEYKDRFKKK